MTCDARSAIQHQYNSRLQQHGLTESMRATNYELSTPRAGFGWVELVFPGCLDEGIWQH